MINAYLTVALSFVMGLSIFLSMPLVFHKKTGPRHMLLFSAVAIGVLVFLLMDLYGDVSSIFGSSSPVSASGYELVFIAGFTLAFLFFMLPKKNRDPEADPKRTSLLSAVGIGFQNLTEGLVFGSAGAAGLSAIYILSLMGFTLQNVTEGFPIAAPLMGLKKKPEKGFVAGAFLLGGIPTIIGTVVGLVLYSNLFIVFFDALASAAILYVTLVLFHVNISRSRGDGKGKHGIDNRLWLTYCGILIGFILAFIVNYI